MLLVGYTALMAIVEVMILICNFTSIKLSVLNLYLYLQLIGGILKKASLLALVLLLGICIKRATMFGIIVGVVAIICILCEQYLILS